MSPDDWPTWPRASSKPGRNYQHKQRTATHTTMPSPLLTLATSAGHRSRIEEALRESVNSNIPHLTDVASHLIGAGGKRLRPMLAVCAAQITQDGPVSREAILGAVTCELVNMGSLYHDDVMDEALTRRGVATANSLWGNSQAVVAGDFLLARASEIAASLGSTVARLCARTIGELCEGQTQELVTMYDPGRSIESYETSIRGKTAALFATCANMGATITGYDKPLREAVSRIGEAYGMVFQIVDDVLDVVSTDKDLGKPAGHDMQAGVYTLPVLLTLAETGPGPDKLRDLLSRRMTDQEAKEALEIVRGGRGVSGALAHAYKFVHLAEEQAESLPETRASEALKRAPRMLLESSSLG